MPIEMPEVTSYAECNCAILESGRRVLCPSCKVFYPQEFGHVALVRCADHRNVPAYNHNAAAGGECVACAFEALREEFQRRLDVLFDTAVASVPRGGESTTTRLDRRCTDVDLNRARDGNQTNIY